MSVNRLDLTVCEQNSPMGPHLLGTLGMIGSPMLLIEGITATSCTSIAFTTIV